MDERMKRNYPWRCLCFGSEQITRITPLRRIMEHLLQIFLTEGRTFIGLWRIRETRVWFTKCNTSSRKIVGSELHGNGISRDKTYKMFLHLPRYIRPNNHIIEVLWKLNFKYSSGKWLEYDSFHFDLVFFWHRDGNRSYVEIFSQCSIWESFNNAKDFWNWQHLLVYYEESACNLVYIKGKSENFLSEESEYFLYSEWMEYSRRI